MSLGEAIFWLIVTVSSLIGAAYISWLKRTTPCPREGCNGRLANVAGNLMLAKQKSMGMGCQTSHERAMDRLRGQYRGRRTYMVESLGLFRHQRVRIHRVEA